MILSMELPQNSYDIVLEHHCLEHCADYLNLKRKALIVTDSGVPEQYSQLIANQCLQPYIVTIPQGEQSKCVEQWSNLLQVMLENGFNRSDCVVACGGGVVGDLAGFSAACYMRGIDFYNCPTTVLSQIDSSIGGKTAIDFGGLKNIVGSFYQPKKVLIDPETLTTLPARQISNGLAEAVKMSAFGDISLFELFEKEDIYSNLDTIIEKSLKIKRDIVQKDEKETGLRKVLNFGHTIGHGIEAVAEDKYHGECVALGMLPMCSETVRERLISILQKLNLDTHIHVDKQSVLQAVSHDKKSTANGITVVVVNELGSFEFVKMNSEQLAKRLAICID